MNFEYMDASYGVALYLRDSEGELHRVGGYRSQTEAEAHIIDLLCSPE